MAREDIFEGAKSGLAFYLAYMNTVAQEIGVDKAFALAAETEKAMGTAQGKLMREQAGGGEFDLKTVTSMALSSIDKGFGISSEVVQETPEKVILRCGKCPVYDAGQMVGMDEASIEAQCRSGSLGFMDCLVKELNPNLAYRLKKFRSGPDDFCEEELSLN